MHEGDSIEMMGDLEGQPPITEQEIAAGIVDSTNRVFSVMLGISATPGPVQSQDNVEGGESRILALLGFTGAWSGTGCVCCTPDLALKISGTMLMSEFSEVNDDVLDAIGEIANMVIGNFKDGVSSTLGQLALTVPTVIFGRNVRARNLNGQGWITVPFDCDGQLLEVKVCLGPTPEMMHDRPTLLVSES